MTSKKPQATTIEQTEVDGFTAITLANGKVSLTMLPELGGKISSLVDLGSGRQWLWTNPEVAYRRVAYGASYVREADTGGWDECFPTVAPCRYPGSGATDIELPDHGELWPLAWETSIGAGGTVVSSRVEGTALPYEFERSITLLPGKATVRLEYAVRNLGPDDLHFIWCAHPLLAVEPGMELLLPASTKMRRYSSVPAALLPADDYLEWPPRVALGAEGFELNVVPPREAGFAVKLWSEPLTEGWAAVRADDGELRFNFDPELVPQVGLWLNAGGWSGTGGAPYFNLGLEPGIGAQDSLADAVERYDQHGTLPAHDERRWWLEVQL